MRDFLFLILAFFLFVIWIVAWLAFHVAGGLIHILVVLAVISLILHFVRRRAQVGSHRITDLQVVARRSEMTSANPVSAH